MLRSQKGAATITPSASRNWFPYLNTGASYSFLAKSSSRSFNVSVFQYIKSRSIRFRISRFQSGCSFLTVSSAASRSFLVLDSSLRTHASITRIVFFKTFPPVFSYLFLSLIILHTIIQVFRFFYNYEIRGNAKKCWYANFFCIPTFSYNIII